MKKIISLLFPLFLIHTAMAQNGHSKKLETVIDLGKYQAIGVAVSPANRLFVSFPRRGGLYEYGLTEIVDGKKMPFPDTEWNSDNGDSTRSFFSVQDLYADRQNNLWVLDSKPAAQPGTEGHFRMLKINLNNNKVEQVYHFGGLNREKSALNDVRIDESRQLAYLSDPGLAAIVVLDLKTDEVRTVLAKSKFALADTGILLAYGGRQMRDRNGKPFVSNINSIALSKDDKYFYFKPINCEKLYRIATAYLSDAALSDADLSAKVETVAGVGITHGMESDEKGNIFLSSSLDYNIKYLSPDGKVHTLVTDARLLWPDSFGVGSDGYLYFSFSQLQREAGWNNGVDKTDYPYRIYRVKRP